MERICPLLSLGSVIRAVPLFGCEKNNCAWWVEANAKDMSHGVWGCALHFLGLEAAKKEVVDMG